MSARHAPNISQTRVRLRMLETLLLLPCLRKATGRHTCRHSPGEATWLPGTPRGSVKPRPRSLVLGPFRPGAWPWRAGWSTPTEGTSGRPKLRRAWPRDLAPRLVKLLHVRVGRTPPMLRGDCLQLCRQVDGRHGSAHMRGRRWQGHPGHDLSELARPKSALQMHVLRGLLSRPPNRGF